MRRTDTHYLWIDFESDGYLDNHPEHCAVLEVGWALTDGNFDVYEDGSALYDPRSFIPTPTVSAALDELRDRAPRVVRDMHDETGLWDTLAFSRSLETITEVEARLLDVIETHAPVDVTLRLAGKGIGPFDVPLVKRLMPRVADLVHYAPLDISSVRRFHADVVGSPLPDAPLIEGTAHRALDDVLGAIAEARTYRDHLVGTRFVKEEFGPGHVAWLPDQFPNCDAKSTEASGGEYDFICTAAAGHAGRHVAHVSGTEAVAHWS